jgi:hypothetical protein
LNWTRLSNTSRCEERGKLGDDPVEVRVEGLQLGALTREARLPFPDSNLDLGKADLIEDGAFNMIGSGLGIVEGDRVELHADGHKDIEERAEGFLDPLVSPADAHDGGEWHLAFAEVYLHVVENIGPRVTDGVVMDGVVMDGI